MEIRFGRPCCTEFLKYVPLMSFAACRNIAVSFSDVKNWDVFSKSNTDCRCRRFRYNYMKYLESVRYASERVAYRTKKICRYLITQQVFPITD